jgi:hypothetical protein
MTNGAISSYVSAIIDHLRVLGRPVVGKIRHGLPYDLIDAKARSLSIVVTQELRELYHIVGGTSVSNGDLLEDLHWFPIGFYMLALDDAAVMYRTFVSDTRWSRTWFPVFANGGGDFIAQVLTARPLAAAPLVHFLLGEGEQQVQFESLTNMLGFMCECFDRNICFVNEDGALDWDWDEGWRIGKKWNPGLPYWESSPND